MRNHIEHLDERIDAWWKQSHTHNWMDRNVRHGIPPGFSDVEVFRNFDHATGELLFWGDRFELAPLVTEAQRILPALELALSAPQPGVRVADESDD
jgi:hypothetical protein